MTALILQATPLSKWSRPSSRPSTCVFCSLGRLCRGRMRNAVPAWQLRRAQRELDRCRRLMRAKNKLPAKTVRTGR